METDRRHWDEPMDADGLVPSVSIAVTALVSAVHVRVLLLTLFGLTTCAVRITGQARACDHYTFCAQRGTVHSCAAQCRQDVACSKVMRA